MTFLGNIISGVYFNVINLRRETDRQRERQTEREQLFVAASITKVITEYYYKIVLRTTVKVTING